MITHMRLGKLLVLGPLGNEGDSQAPRRDAIHDQRRTITSWAG